MDPINIFGFAAAAGMAIKFLLTLHMLEERVATLEAKVDNAEDELSRLESELDSRT
jgi:hypothetical protein